MCFSSCAFVSGGVAISNVSRKDFDTDTRASSGHGKNQSIVHELYSEGNLRARSRNLEPTGEKESTTCKQSRTRLMQKFHSSSMDGSSPLVPCSFMYTFLLSRAITSFSSLAMRPATSPVERSMFMYSRKFSDLISASVRMKVTLLPPGPAS